MTIKEAIEDLEFERHVKEVTCPYKWTKAQEFAYNNLKTISVWKDAPVKAIRYFLNVLWCKHDGIDQEFIDEIISKIEERLHDN